MKTPQHTQLPVAQLWQMPPEQLRLYARVATKLADLHAQIERVAADGMPTLQTIAKPRQPMRAPWSRRIIPTAAASFASSGTARRMAARLAISFFGKPSGPASDKTACTVSLSDPAREHDNGIRRLALGTYAAGPERRS